MPRCSIGLVLRRCSSMGRSIPGHAGASTWWPRASKRSTQYSQLSGVSQSPWISTIGLGEAGGESVTACSLRIDSRLRKRVNPAGRSIRLGSMADCTIIRSGETYSGHQGLDYRAGISAESARSQGICMLRLTMEPGQRARAHMHEHHETTIYLMSGRVELWYGPRLEHHELVEAGDFVHIPAGVPHVPANTGD